MTKALKKKALKKKAYGVVGTEGVLAVADPAAIAMTLPRRAIRALSVPTRARLELQFFPAGPWDLVAEPFGIHRYVREIFVDGVAVRDSEQYRDMSARVSDRRAKGSVWGCRTVADVDRYFHQLLEMYEDMRCHGYRPHTDLGTSPHEEVKVHVGRGGDLIKASGGNHRVSFAKLLELPSIPVLVRGLHRDYLRRFRGPPGVSTATAAMRALEAAGLGDWRHADVQRVAGRPSPTKALRRRMDARRESSG